MDAQSPTTPDRARTDLDRLPQLLSSTLIRQTPQQFDAAIERLLQQIGEAFGADCSSLEELMEDGAPARNGEYWGWPAVGAQGFAAVQRAPWYTAHLLSDRPVVLERIPDDVPPEGRGQLTSLEHTPLKSMVTVPVTVAGRRTCALSVGLTSEHRRWTLDVLDRLRLLAEMLAAGVDRCRQAEALAGANAAVARLATADVEMQTIESHSENDFDDIIGDSPLLRAALARVQEVAPTDATVVLVGETGTGKELFARAVHDRSPRRGRPFVRVNCAALPPTLIESELFGHERGAFTGAISMRQGRFELANKGTIFLDEIGDLPHDVQAKLLRVLQENEFERVGSSQTRKVDVRIVAATHHDLEAAVAEGRFRADLFYRLSVYPISLPPLRERAEDVPRLVWFFINKRQRALNAKIARVPAPVMNALQQHTWPGNVRELENVIERAMIHSRSDTLFLDGGLGGRPSVISGGSVSLEDVERRHIADVLRNCGWRINGASNAAEQLGLHPNTLRFRMSKLGIRRPAGPVVVRHARRAES
jgi:formate hydrogenlyase transcriptional activator